MNLTMPIIAEKSRQTSIKAARMLLSQIETEPFGLVLKMKLSLTEGDGSFCGSPTMWSLAALR